MKKLFSIVLAALALTGCTKENATNKEFVSISAQDAKNMMDTRENYIILDVREQYEYDAGHIPGAILIPNGQISQRAEQELPDKDQLILVYCRSGRRSKEAAQKLADMGYTNIKEFGGIIDWPYEIEK